MTEATKPVTRSLFSTIRGRQIAVTIHPTWVSVRLKRTRQVLAVESVALYHFAARLDANRAREEQQAAKKTRRFNA